MKREIEKSRTIIYAAGKFYEAELNDLKSKVISVLSLAKEKNIDSSSLPIHLATVNGFLEMVQDYDKMNDKHRRIFNKIVDDFSECVLEKIEVVKDKLAGKCVDTKTRYVAEHEKQNTNSESVAMLRNGVMVSYNKSSSDKTEKTPSVPHNKPGRLNISMAAIVATRSDGR
jgi:hypothetical protein